MLRPVRTLRSLVFLARPRQWIKNLLVFAAPLAAGVLSHRHDALVAAGTFGVFSLAAAGMYFLNDTLDSAADRLHPVKRARPVAAGEVPKWLAVGLGMTMSFGSVGAAWALAGHELAIVIGAYLVVTSVYSLRLKHEPVLDLACVASGFVLRAIAGAVAVGVPLSVWFLTVVSFGSLLVVAGKRSAEQSELADLGPQVRRTLAIYPSSFLRSVRLLSASVAVTACCFWSFGAAGARHPGHHPIWFELSIVPFVLAVLHLELRFERGEGAAPEDLALSDGVLQLLGLLWLALVVVGVYS